MTEQPQLRLVRRRSWLLHGASASALLFAGAAAAQVTSADTRTVVTPDALAQHVTVRTSAVSADGGVGFNRFKTFNVGAGKSADLQLPGSAHSLVNLVQSKALIEGIVQSSRNGRIGGNLFFVVPEGMLIGPAGRIDTGRLIVRGNPSGSGDWFAENGAYPSLNEVLTGGFSASLDVSGTINAPGGIDFKAATVKIGGALNTGAAGIAAIGAANIDTGALVSTAGLVEGGKLVIRDGGIKIVAGDTVELGSLDARPVAYAPGGPAVAAGIEVAGTKSIVANGPLVAWSGQDADRSGDIDLAVAREARPGRRLEEIGARAYYDNLVASTSIAVLGEVKGGTVTIGAKALSSNETDLDLGLVALSVLQSRLQGKLMEQIFGRDAVDLGAFVSLIDAATKINIGASSVITSRGALTVSADTTAASIASAAAKASDTAALAVSYSALNAKAEITIDGRLDARGALTVSARNTANADVSVRAISDGQAVTGGVAFGEADVAATVAVNNSVKGASVAIKAVNANADGKNYEVGANGINTGNGVGGGVAAVSRLDIAAKVSGPGGITATAGDVAVEASTVTAQNHVNATAITGQGGVAQVKAVVQGADAGTFMNFVLDHVEQEIRDKFGGAKEKTPEATPKARIAAATGVALVEQSGTAELTGRVLATGSVSVEGLVRDASVRNNVESEVSSKRVDLGEQPVVGGAAAWGQYDYVSKAIVGGDVTAKGLSVKATTDRPAGVEYGNPFRNPEGEGEDTLSWLGSDVMPKLTPSLGVKAGFFGTYAGSQIASDGQTKPTVGGNVAYTLVDAKATAWIDRNVKLTLGAAGAEVKSLVDVRNLSLAGPIPVTATGIGIKGGSSALGGALGLVQVNSDSVAGIDDGVSLLRADGAGAAPLTVAANGRTELLTLAPLSGEGGQNAFIGTFAVNEVSGKTHATISKSALLDLGGGALTLGADTTLNLGAITGSLAKSKGEGVNGGKTAASVGVSGALNLADVDTVAQVGDESGDDPTADDGPAARGRIVAGAVDADAFTRGQIGAFSVAGTSISGMPEPKEPDTDPSTDTKASGVSPSILQRLTTSVVDYASVKSKIVAAYVELKKREAQARGFQEELAGAQSGAAPVTRGFGAAGSASVNISELATRVDLSSATIVKGATGTGNFSATAADGTDLVALTGGAALAAGTKPLDEAKLVAGAFGLSYSANEASVGLTDTDVGGFTNLAARAAQTGNRIGAGLSLAVDQTKTTKGNVVAGSASILVSRDGARVTATDGAIVGPDQGAGSVSLLAYNGLTLGAGAAGFAAGSASQAGAALTLIDADNGEASAAKLVRTKVANYADLSVRALTAARVAGIAAAGMIAFGDERSKGGAASLSFNRVDLDAVATIDTGLTVDGSIAVSGAVDVYAGDLAKGTAIDLASAGLSADRFDYASAYKPKASAFDSDAGLTDDQLEGGTNILSLAATAAFAGKAREAGLSLSVNLIDNDRTALILGGGAARLSAGRINVNALDRAAILSAAAGVALTGGKGEVGSLSVNNISGAASAGLQGRGDSATAFQVSVNGAGPNLSVGAQGAANIYSLAGAVAITDQRAGGLALSANQIVRASAATDPDAAVQPGDAGIHAALDKVALAGAPDVSVQALNGGTIASLAIAGTVALNGNAISGATAANRIAPVVRAHVGAVDYLTRDGRDLRIAAEDLSVIRSGSFYLSGADKKAVGVGATVNLIDTRVSATLDAAASDRGFVVSAPVEAYAFSALGERPFAEAAGGAVESVRVTSLPASGTLLLNSRDGDLRPVRVGDTVSGEDIRAGRLIYEPDYGSDPVERVTFGFVPNARILVRDLLVSAASRATSQSASVGIAAAGEYSGAGSVVANATDARADALVRLSAADIVARGSVGVLATRDAIIDTGAGALALAGKGGAVGASVVVNDVRGGASARLVEAGGQAHVTARAETAGVANVRTGALDASLPQFDGLDVVRNAALADTVKLAKATVQGVAVNASSSHASRAIAVTGAAAAAEFAVATTAVVGNIGGDTAAEIGGVDLTSAGAADLRAGTHTVTATFAGAVAGSTGTGLAAPIVSDAHSGATSATLSGGSVRAAGELTVKATADQSATALAIAAGVGSQAAAIAAVSPRFQARTSAVLESTPINAGGVLVNADSDARSYATFGSLSAGSGGALAAAVVVSTNENETSAEQKGSALVAAPRVAIEALGAFDAQVAGASLAAGGDAALVGNGVGVVHRGVVKARADGLLYQDGGDVLVKAREIATFRPIVGQLAASGPFGGGASLGAIAVLSQSKVDADLDNATILYARNVDVQALGGTSVDALQLGVAVGGVGIGANVTYIGVGQVRDTGALFAEDGASAGEDSKLGRNAGSSGGGNRNLAFIAGSNETTAQGASRPGDVLIGQDRSSHLVRGSTGAVDANGARQASARDAFGQVKQAAADGESRVRAQIGAGGTSTVSANAVSLTSQANLLSRSANYQGAAGLAAGSAAIGITRNAGNSIARIADGSAVQSNTVSVSALTDDRTSLLDGTALTGPAKAAEAFVVGGTVGGLTAAIALADVKLQSVSVAEMRGEVLAGNLSIKAEDGTDAATEVYGVSGAAAGALNVAVAKTVKTNVVAAGLGGSVLAGDVSVGSIALGGTKAYALAAAGGNVFAGNAAVALASDSQAIDATVLEGTFVRSDRLSVKAAGTPVVDAQADGIAVGGAVAIGASVATATSDAAVRARIGEGGCINCDMGAGTLLLDARLIQAAGRENVRASAKGSAGGGLVGLNATVATARNLGIVQAELGANLGSVKGAALQLGPVAVDIVADRSVAQHALADGVTASLLLSVGAQVAKSESAGQVDAALTNVDGSARGLTDENGRLLAAPDTRVAATSSDANRARAIAGAGALGAGVASLATTDTGGTVVARIAPDAGKIYRTGKLDISARSTADYRAEADATQASLVGGSGSRAENRVGSSARVELGQALANAAGGGNSAVHANEVVLAATNTVGSGGSSGGFVNGSGGGAFAGAAALMENRVDQGAAVDLRDGVTLRQYGDATENKPAVTIRAASTTDRSHSAALKVGGAVVSPYAKIDSDYAAANAVTVGSNSLIRADGAISLDTATTQRVTDAVAVQVYGLAGIGGGSTDTRTHSEGTVTVRDRATIESLSDVRIAAGAADSLTADAGTEVFNWTALPISFEHDATARATSANRLTLGAAVIRSARDLLLDAQGKGLKATAVGTGHNPYLALFGGTSSSGDATTAGAGTIDLTGTRLTAGFLARRDLAITGNTDGGWTAVARDFDGTDAVTRTVGYDASGNLVSDIGLADADSLFRYRLGESQTTARQALVDKIAALSKQIRDAGGTVPADPNAPGLSAAQKDAAIIALEKAAAVNATVAQLETAYTTLATLGPDALGTGVFAGDIFASGGLARIDTDRIIGRDASVVAQSAPRITIDLQAKRDLVLGDMFIPFKSSGPVTFGGAAGKASLTGLPGARLVEAGANDSSDGVIRFTAGKAFGADVSNIITVGSILNVGGSFTATAHNGDYAQFGTVQAGSFSVEVPNGLFSISAGGNDFTMGVPIKLYYGALLNTLNNGHATISAQDAASGIASWLAGWYFDTGVYADGTSRVRGGNDLNNFYASGTRPALLERKVDSFDGKVVQWTGCATVDCELYSGDDSLNTSFTKGVLTENYLGRYYAPLLSYVNPVKWATLTPQFKAGKVYPVDPGRIGDANNKGENTGTIKARQVAIDAKFVNISGDIVAGPNKYRTVKVLGTADGAPDLGDMFGGAAAGWVSQPLQTYGLGLVENDSNIGVRFVVTGSTYNPQTGRSRAEGYLLADDIAASAGGSISITGRIVNTNPLGGGSLRVDDGHAIISVTNQTNYDLRVNTLNTGVDVSGIIKLRNIDRDGVIRTDIYRHNTGEAVRHDQIYTRNGSVTQQSSSTLGQGIGTDQAISYATDQTEVWFRYAETRGIQRDVFYETTNGQNATHELATTPWAWSGVGSRPNGGSFVELTNSAIQVSESVDARDIRMATTYSGTTNRTGADIVQILTGKATSVVNAGRQGFLNINKDFFAPETADVTLITAVKATYPINLRFNDFGPGFMSLRSDTANIDIGGPIANAGGTVVLTTRTGSIRQLEGGSVLARVAEFRAGGSVGSLTRPIDLQTGNRVGFPANLIAIAGSGDVALNIGSTTLGGGALDDVTVNQISARNGTVSIVSNTGLMGTGSQQGEPAIVARTIELKTKGAVGGRSGQTDNPLQKGALIVSVGDGGIAVDAGGDVALQSNVALDGSDVLRIRSIATPSAVLLRSAGSIVGVDNGAQVDETKLDRLLQAASVLNLTPAGCSGDCTVSPARRAEIVAQIRAEGLNAYDFITRVGGLNDVEAQDTVSRIDRLASFKANGVALGRDGKIVFDASRDANGSARAWALAELRKAGSSATQISDAEVAALFQTVADPVVPLVGTALPDLQGLTAAAKLAAVQSLVKSSNLGAAANDAYGRLQQLEALRAQGVAIDAAGRVTVTPSAATAKDGALYRLALETLKSGTNSLRASGGFEVVSNPSDADIARGIQRHVDQLTGTILPLFGNQLPTLAGAADPIGYLTGLIRPDGLTAYNLTGRAAALATLTDAFGGLPGSRSSIGTATVRDAYLVSRTEGATWRQSQLDFQLPSTAFTPVADTQFELRAPVIKAGSLSLVAGNSIGNFGDPQTFRFTQGGLVDANGAAITDETQKKLARAYLASAGPGDLSLQVIGAPIEQVNVTSRRDRPLVIDVTGTVNAFAATDFNTLALRSADPASLHGDILLTNLSDMRVGSVVSLKPRFAGYAGGSCGQVVFSSIAGCDSRVRLVAPSITGVATGAAQLRAPIGLPLSTNADGRAIVMGGKLRLEASNGDLIGSDGGAILVDTGSLEVVRAAGDARIEKRAPRSLSAGSSTYAFSTDLALGDVFAGDTFALNNPDGSVRPIGLPSPIEPRNARIVADAIELVAAGDLGGAAATESGQPGRLDIQAATIRTLAAGYGAAFAGGFTAQAPTGCTRCVVGVPGFFPGGPPSGAVGVVIDRLPPYGLLILEGPKQGVPQKIEAGTFLRLDQLDEVVYYDSVAGNPARSFGFGVRFSRQDFLAGTTRNVDAIVRGSTVIGGGTAGVLGATGRIALQTTVGSDLTLDGAVRTGGSFDLTTGALRIGDRAAAVRLSDPAAPCAAATCTANLSAMNLTLLTGANVATDRSLTLASLTGDGASLTSRAGSIAIGHLNAARTPGKLTTVNAAQNLSIGTMALGSALLTANGSAAITGYSYLDNLTVIAPTVVFGGDVTATAALDVAARRVDIAGRANGGTVRLTGSLTRPDLYMEEVNFLSGNWGVEARDQLTLFAGRSTGVARSISGASLDVRTRSDLAALNLLASNGGKVIVDGVGSDLSVTNFLSVRGALTVSTGGSLSLARGDVWGTLRVTAGDDIHLGQGLSIGHPAYLGAVNLTAVDTITGNADARLIGNRSDATLTLTASAIDLGPQSLVSGLAVNANARGVAQFGTVAALAAAQDVTVKGGTRVAVGDVTGRTVTLASSGGSVATGQITAKRAIVDATGRLRTGGVTADSATLTGKADVALAGRTRTTAGALLVTAGTALSIEGEASASGGMTLTGQNIQTVGNGFLNDLDAPGVLTSLRADQISVRFDTGAATGTALRVDARGRTGGNAEQVDLRFASLRPVTMPALFTRRGTLSLSTPLTVDKLTMVEWLLLNLGQQSVALRGTLAPPPAGRTISSGALTNAKLVATPGANGGAPTIRLNDTLR
jgi:filamentous hemagglutinin family protein